jgi:hypothetical protein
MPAPAGYLGYTVPEETIFLTCVQDYYSARHTPSQAGLITAAIARGLFSLFEFTVELNNLNGSVPVPAGNVIVGRQTYSWQREEPCGTVRAPSNKSYFEKFATPAIDLQSFITVCESRLIQPFKRTSEYAIMPDPNPLVKIPPGEHAAAYPDPPDPLAFYAAQIAALNAAFNAAVTLKFDYQWEYDNCKNPRTTSCGKTNCLSFAAVTLDPAAGGAVTWTLPGAPKKYASAR